MQQTLNSQKSLQILACDPQLGRWFYQFITTTFKSILHSTQQFYQFALSLLIPIILYLLCFSEIPNSSLYSLNLGDLTTFLIKKIKATRYNILHLSTIEIQLTLHFLFLFLIKMERSPITLTPSPTVFIEPSFCPSSFS